VLIADMAADATFATYRGRVEAWTLDPPAPFAASEPLPDPRTCASDFTQDNAVPADIRPWLLRVDPATASAAYTTWRAAAAPRLLASLADRVSIRDGAREYGFIGPPACTVEIANFAAPAYFERALEGAIWVFDLGARDAETRHLLLANEWARTFRKQGLAELGEGSLESAKGAYNAYVKSGSRETLKALADLRKSVVDETQKISQRAQDMIGAIWKDIAVASAPFVLKILSDATRAPSGVVAGGLALGAALFLAFTYSMQVYINHRWLAQADEARTLWKGALNLVLSQTEIAAFSDVPIATSIDDYRRVRLVVGMLYGVLVAILLGFAWVNFTAPSGTSPTPASTDTPVPRNMPTPTPTSTQTKTPTKT
jgi:hypothetical protein